MCICLLSEVVLCFWYLYWDIGWSSLCLIFSACVHFLSSISFWVPVCVLSQSLVSASVCANEGAESVVHWSLTSSERQLLTIGGLCALKWRNIKWWLYVCVCCVRAKLYRWNMACWRTKLLASNQQSVCIYLYKLDLFTFFKEDGSCEQLWVIVKVFWVLGI